MKRLDAIQPRLIHALLLLFFMLLVEQQQGFAQCPNDVTPPVAVCQALLARDVPPGGTITVAARDFDGGSHDNCTAMSALQFFIETGTPSASPPSTSELPFSASQPVTQAIVLWVVDQAGNASYCTSSLELTPCQPANALVCNDQVTVELDVNYTATIDAFDMLEGGPYCNYNAYLINLDLIGNPVAQITLGPEDIGTHIMRVSGQGSACWGTLIVLPGVLNAECPVLYVDLASARIRPCFPGRYTVFFVNASTQAVSDTYVEVTLDDALTFTGSSLPASSLGNQRYRFETGDLAAGEHGTFTVEFTTSCAIPVGATHCSEAHIYPDTLCGGGGLPWSGAEVSVEGNCANDTVYLQIKNTGAGPNAQALEFVVVEDVLMRQTGTFSLGSGQTLVLDPIPAKGATIRLQAEQEPGYPYGGMPAVAVEGCGGFTQGMVTVFPNDDSSPFIAVDCRENTASYDPNDKQALPKGYADERFIEKNTPLQYMIRFQNTGTDTAFKVVLVDTLSGFLYAKGLRPGASSHPYTFQLDQGNILRFTFDNILLPYQAVDEDGSQGFVQFNIPQMPDNPDGTRIENSAAIYFDFNAPVLTNTTFHTVGSHFIEVTATGNPAGNIPLHVYPNPAVDAVFFDAGTDAGEPLRFILSDLTGRVVLDRQAVALPMRLERNDLETGVYFFRFTGRKGQPIWSGKIMVK